MSEYEVLDLISSLRTEVTLHSMNFFVVLSAYLFAAFLMKPEIPKLYIGVLTTLYSLYLFMPAGASINSLRNLQALVERYMLEFPNTDLILRSTIPIAWFLTALFVVSWFISILFMFHRRTIEPSAEA